MKKYIIGYITGIITMLFVVVTATILYNAKDIEFASKDTNWNVTNVEEAINDIKENYSPNSYFINKTWDYDYSGGEQIFEAILPGMYKIETWGAQGGTYSSYQGGYGAYAVGEIHLNKDEKVYLNIGGMGTLLTVGSCIRQSDGGYNGGGYGLADTAYAASGGGGATHASFKSGLLSTLSNDTNKIIIVSSGGGGAYYGQGSQGTAGNGGGIKGNDGIGHPTYVKYGPAKGGNQTVGGSSIVLSGTIPADLSANFGKGADCPTNSASGGGGGFYGGGSYNGGSGAGGSSYIANTNLTNKAMYCYNCATSNEDNTKTISNTCVNSKAVEQCSKQGNGYARITLISID